MHDRICPVLIGFCLDLCGYFMCWFSTKSITFNTVKNVKKKQFVTFVIIVQYI